MGIEKIVKGFLGGAAGYALAALLVPYYAPYATAARVVSTGVGIYAVANSGSSNNSASHAHAPSH